MQIPSQMGHPFPQLVFCFLSPIRDRLMCNKDSLKDLICKGTPLALCSTEGRSCLFSILIGYAVGSVLCAAGLAHGGYCHATRRSMKWQLSAAKNSSILVPPSNP